MRRLFTLKAEGSVLLRKLPPTKRKCDKGMRSLFTFTNSGLLFSRTRRNKQDKERADLVKGAYYAYVTQGKRSTTQYYTAYFSTSGLSLSESEEASKTRRASIYRRGAYYAYVTQGKRSTTQYCAVYSRSENKSGVSERKKPILLSHRFFIHLKRVFPAHKGADEH